MSPRLCTKRMAKTRAYGIPVKGDQIQIASPSGCEKRDEKLVRNDRQYLFLNRGYQSQFIRFPDQKFSFLCLCNIQAGSGKLMEKVADLYLADYFLNPVHERSEAPVPIRLSEQELAVKTGVY